MKIKRDNFVSIDTFFFNKSEGTNKIEEEENKPVFNSADKKCVSFFEFICGPVEKNEMEKSIDKE